MVTKYEKPRARLPSKLPSRPIETVAEGSRDQEDLEDLDDDGTWDRRYVKTQSLKSLRSELKKAARQSKQEAALSKTM